MPRATAHRSIASAQAGLSPALRAYIAALALAALALVWLSRGSTAWPDGGELLLAIAFAGLMVLASLFPVAFVPKAQVHLDTSVMFASALLFPPLIAIAVAGTGKIAAQILRKQPAYQIAFNGAERVVQTGLAALFLESAGWDPGSLRWENAYQLPGILAAAGIMVLVNTATVAIAIALRTEESPVRVWWRLTRALPSEYPIQFVLGFLTAATVDVHPWTLPLFVLPTLVVYRSSQRNIQLQRQAQALAHQSLHDALTGLPNRALFVDRVQHALTRAERSGETAVVLCLDLDRFKVVNDSLGHELGDRILVAVADRLRGCLRSDDTVARFGGDEFTILAEDYPNVSDAVRIAERIIRTLEHPFPMGGHEIVVGARIGIALGTAGRDRAEDVLRHANLALHRAKRAGKARIEVFNRRMGDQALERLRLESELCGAIERQEFRVYYQPKVELATHRVEGMEALVRWQHPRRGLLSPAEFVPLAEETGLIVLIGRWVLEEACGQARRWQRQAPDRSPLTMAVNISAAQFQDETLAAQVAGVLAASGLPPGLLRLEITETTVMANAETAIGVLRQLKALGVRIAIDDFGMGYSSLSYLQRFPVDALKIDRSFVEGLGSDPGNTAIVRAVSTLGRALGIQVIAEGVETAEQLRELRRLGLQIGQGYYFAAPFPCAGEDCTERLTAIRTAIG